MSFENDGDGAKDTNGEIKKPRYAKKGLSLKTLVTLATLTEKEKPQFCKDIKFFTSLMASLLTLETFLDLDSHPEMLDRHRIEKKTRAIFHIVHHLYVVHGPISTSPPRKFNAREATVMVSFSLYQKLICHRIRIRAQICSKFLLKSDLINDVFDHCPKLEDTLYFSLEKGFSNDNIFTLNELNYFIWLTGLLSYSKCKKPNSIPY